mgnify:CR=1 FL=1
MGQLMCFIEQMHFHHSDVEKGLLSSLMREAMVLILIVWELQFFFANGTLTKSFVENVLITLRGLPCQMLQHAMFLN